VVTVPAFVWRRGFACRAVILGASAGLCLGVLAWLDSGFPIAGAIVFVVGGGLYGVLMARRMTQYWPEARNLTDDDRVSVVRAARRGEAIADERLAQPVADYARGLRAAAEAARPLRWLFIVVLVVAVATAAWDAAFGSWGNAAASAVYLVALIVEVFWWPKRLDSLLAAADRAAALG
jgi:hypothetical protein